jgi:hypothetical protein
MKPARKKLVSSKEERPVLSFTRVIEVAPRLTGFTGWGPTKWN